ncbi:MAG: type II toxin-antitoxin system HicB family antitoxin [Candidatus Caenarcaniphilales bacterium]|jgi:predicted HicB family RNase H-like nuclease|nr:type II toxin-antitoxin system HicB family antitoxin [Candidatus Caenarcaniphilales bacterium]
MSNLIEYKGYYGSVNFSAEDKVFYGKLEFINSAIMFEGTDIKSLEKDFKNAVEDYLTLCQKKGIDPQRPFKGSFNVRTGEDLHRKLVVYAEKNDLNLNKVVVEALEEYLKKAA